MKSLSKTLIKKNIRVNVVSPGHTIAEGGFWDKARTNDQMRYRAAVDETPIGRLGTAEEIAKVVVFLSSKAASFVSGSNFIVDGNLTSHIQN